MPPFQKLLERYNNLAKHEQYVLRVLSVIHEPVNQTALNHILAELHRSTESFMDHSPVVGRPLRDKLETRGLIGNKLGRMKCDSSIEEWLTHQAVVSGEFDSILKVSLHEIPLAIRAFHSARSPASVRELRYALHSGDDDKVLRLLEVSDPFQSTTTEHEHDLLDICASPLYTEWFSGFSPAIQYQVLRPILANSAISWTDSRQFLNLLESQLIASPDPAPQVLELHAEQCLIRGNWQAAREDLSRIDTVQGEVLAASLLFLEDDAAAAATTFQSALTRMRRETRKKKIAIRGLPGVIYLLTLLKDQGAGNAALATQQIETIDKLKQPDLYTNAMWRLKMAREVSEGRRNFDPSVLQMSFRYVDPLTHLLIGLSFHWSGAVPDKAFTDRLAKARTIARESGYTWFAAECEQLLARFEGRQIERVAPWGTPLTALFPDLTDWERSLYALTQVVAPDVKAVPKKTDGERRLTWLVENDAGFFTLKPKEQKLRKNGTWTAGRNVALRRLVEEQHAFSHMTDADRRICQSIREERNYGYYGPRHIYSLEGIDALSAAIGHPHLLRHDEPTMGMEIQDGNAELIVSEQGEIIRLTLVPYPTDEEGLVVEDVPGRLRVYRYSKELLHVAQILTNDGLQVPRSAKDRVLESVSAIAPLLTIHSDIPGMSQSTAEFVPPDPRLYIHLQPLESGLRLSFHVQPFTTGPVLVPGQGGESIFAEIDGKQQHTQRDLDAECALRDSVVAACTDLYEVSPGEWRWEETEAALEGLLALQSLGDDVVLSWPEGKQIKLSKSAGVSQMSVSLRHKTDWFEIDGELAVDADQVYSMQALMELVSASTGRFIQLGDNQFLTLTTELRTRLEDLRSYESKGRIHTLNAQGLEESLEGMSIDADEAWRGLQERLRAARELEPVVPTTLQADLRDYQVLGYRWLARLASWGAGACLADDMGLGKTLQALAQLVNCAAQGPSLVIAPTSVCTNWLEEAARFAPTLKPIRFGDGDRASTLGKLQPYDVVICSYGLLQTEAERIQAIHWNVIVADEAQAFKNATTKRSKAVMGLVGDFRMIATGTPIENHLGELWNLFSFINPGLLGSRDAFNDKFANPIEGQKDAKARTTLKKLISPFMLRRLKRDVLTELPPRTEITIRVDAGPEEVALYEALRLEAVEQLASSKQDPNQQRFQVLASITKLRRAVCNPNMVLDDANLPSAKLDAFANILDELLENKHKALVFSQFVQHLAFIRRYLDRRGTPYQYLDGSTPVKQRKKAVDAFQAGSGELFLISLKAGGIGLNLTAADYVIHMDPWWNPAVEDQASDRAHRIGQLRAVTVYRLVVSNTIEEKIVDLHGEKRDLADSLLEGSEMSAKMSLDDMLALLNE